MRVLWLGKAVADLDAIEAFIGRDNPAAARAMEQRIESAVRLLERQPHLGRPGRVDGTRELVVAGTPYLVVYSVLSGAVRILAVFHGAQQRP